MKRVKYNGVPSTINYRSRDWRMSFENYRFLLDNFGRDQKLFAQAFDELLASGHVEDLGIHKRQEQTIMLGNLAYTPWPPLNWL